MPVTYKGRQGTMHVFELPDPSGSGGTVTSAVDEATAQRVAQHTGITLGEPSYIGPQGATPLGTAGADMGMGPAPTRPQMAGGDQRLAMAGMGMEPMDVQPMQEQSRELSTPAEQRRREAEQEQARPQAGTIPLRRPGQPRQQGQRPEDMLRARRVAARPASMVPVGVTQQGIDPERLDQLREQQQSLHKQQFRTAQQREQMERKQLEAQQAQLEQVAAERQAEAAEAQRPLLELQERIDRRQREFDQLREQVRNQEVDLDAAQGGSGGKGLGIIAAALGAFGSTLSGTPNHAAQMLDRIISRHVDAQLANMDSRSRELTNEERRLMAMSDDRDELRMRLKVLQRESEIASLETAATEGQLGGLQQATLESLQALRQQQLADQATLEQMVTRSESARFDRGSPGGVVWEIDPREKLLTEASELQRKRQGSTEKQVYYRGQNIGNAPSDKAAEDIRGQIATVENISTAVQRLKEKAAEVDRIKKYAPWDYDKASVEYEQQAEQLKSFYWKGVLGKTESMTDADAKRIDPIIPSDPSVLVGKTRAGLDEIETEAKQQLANKFRANNLPVPPPLRPSSRR